MKSLNLTMFSMKSKLPIDQILLMVYLIGTGVKN